jgi:hypothetical protein
MELLDIPGYVSFLKALVLAAWHGGLTKVSWLRDDIQTTHHKTTVESIDE